MSLRLHVRRILACCLLMAWAGSAMAGEIVECITQQHVITFRDTPCRAGEDALHIFGPDGTPLDGKVRHVAQTETPVFRHGTHAAAIGIVKVPSSHGLSTDVATLREAKAVLDSMDRMSKLAHQTSLAQNN